MNVGPLQAQNNLADLDNVTTSRNSLGLGADIVPPISANTMLVDNAAGTARESKTFAQVRSLLSVIGADSAGPMVEAYWAGVADTNTAAENDTALAAIMAALPSVGGKIYIQGQPSIASKIAAAQKSNIIFVGNSGINAGAGSPSRLVWTGTGSGDAVDFGGSSNCGARGCDIINQNGNTGFTGRLVNFDAVMSGGVVTAETKSPILEDLLISTASSSNAQIIGVALDGVTGAVLRRVAWAGQGMPLRGIDPAKSGYSNDVSIIDNQFRPVDCYPIRNPGTSWRIAGGYAQAWANGSPGVLSCANDTYLAGADFIGLSIEDFGCFDVTSATSSSYWMQNLRGRRLSIKNILFGAGGGTPLGVYSIGLSSVVGAEITLCEQGGGSALVGFQAPDVGTQKNSRVKVFNNGVSYGAYDVGSIGGSTTDDGTCESYDNWNVPGATTGHTTTRRIFDGLPASNPLAANELWTNSAVVTVSAG